MVDRIKVKLALTVEDHVQFAVRKSYHFYIFGVKIIKYIEKEYIQIFIKIILYSWVVLTTECDAGSNGAGGACDCTTAKGLTEGEWRQPWCHQGKCYTGQAYDKCVGKSNGHALGDGTWCWNAERNTECPTTTGKIT